MEQLQTTIVDKMNEIFGSSVHRVKKARKHVHVCCLKDCLFQLWLRQDQQGLTFFKVISQHHSVLAHSSTRAKQKLLFE
jgi:hypothetical protein